MADAPLALDPSQRAAVDLLCEAPIGVVTGGPGTGKTTSLRAALTRMHGENAERVKLCAPTGKASKRMSEATGHEAQTIHRLLKYSPERGFQLNAAEPLEADAVVVDEASMVDIELMAALMTALPSHARLLLVGDADQLASVGPGQVLQDLVECGLVPVARLSTVHRSAAESWVCRNAPRIRAREPVELETAHDFRFCPCEGAEDVTRTIESLAVSAGVDQVLTPQRTGACGTETLNARLQAQLNPDEGQPRMTFRDIELRVGDRVIQTANNYELGVFNGEVGTIVSAGPEMLEVDFGGAVVPYNPLQAMALRHAWALSIHKSQGSEFGWVVVVCHSTHTRMLTARLLYTAVTRAKRGVILVGNTQGLEAARRHGHDAARNSALVERIRGER